MRLNCDLPCRETKEDVSRVKLIHKLVKITVCDLLE